MALPIDFITRTRALLGEEFDRLEAALSADVPVSIRINDERDSRSQSRCSSRLVRERFLFAGTVVFHLRSSIPCGGLLRAGSVFHVSGTSDQAYVKEPVRCLDLCAAPGGKSTHLASLLPDGSLLVSNEVIRSRSYVLAENIAKWGHPDTIVIQ